MYIHCTLTPTEPHWLPLSPTEPPRSPTVPHWPSLISTEPERLHWAPPLTLAISTEPNWPQLSPIEPNVASTYRHWFIFIHQWPIMTLSCPKWTTFDHKSSLITPDYPLIVLKDFSPTNYFNYHQCMQFFLQKRQPIMHYDPKSHLTSIYSSII